MTIFEKGGVMDFPPEMDTEIDNELLEFHDEIRRLVASELGGKHFKNLQPELLDSADMKFWNQFKELVSVRDAEQIIEIVDGLSSENFSKLRDVNDPKITSQAELRSWLRGRMAAIKGEAQGCQDGSVPAEEFKQFMEKREKEIKV